MRWFAFENVGLKYFLRLNEPDVLSREAYRIATQAAKTFTDRKFLQVSMLHETPFLPMSPVFEDQNISIYLRTRGKTEAAA